MTAPPPGTWQLTASLPDRAAQAATCEGGSLPAACDPGNTLIGPFSGPHESR
jgi:hypothetical protein